MRGPFEIISSQNIFSFYFFEDVAHQNEIVVFLELWKMNRKDRIKLNY